MNNRSFLVRGIRNFAEQPPTKKLGSTFVKFVLRNWSHNQLSLPKIAFTQIILLPEVHSIRWFLCCVRCFEGSSPFTVFRYVPYG